MFVPIVESGKRSDVPKVRLGEQRVNHVNMYVYFFIWLLVCNSIVDFSPGAEQSAGASEARLPADPGGGGGGEEGPGGDGGGSQAAAAVSSTGLAETRPGHRCSGRKNWQFQFLLLQIRCFIIEGDFAQDCACAE